MPILQIYDQERIRWVESIASLIHVLQGRYCFTLIKSLAEISANSYRLHEWRIIICRGRND